MSSSSRVLVGHRGRVFDLRVNAQQTRLLSASEDGTARLWAVDRPTHRCMRTFTHDTRHEVLRVNFLSDREICIAGSNGRLSVWRSEEDDSEMNNAGRADSRALCSFSLHHDEDHSQIYVLESHPLLSHCLLSGADSDLALWDVGRETLLSCWHFPPAENGRGFGGDRNPDAAVYVFDAKWHPSCGSNILIALSDQSVCLLDPRLPVSLMDSQTNGQRQRVNRTNEVAKQAPPISARLQLDSGDTGLHITAVNWSPTQEYICCTSFSCGAVALFDIRMGSCILNLKAHDATCYGSQFLANGDHCLSWSTDSFLKVWKIRGESVPQLEFQHSLNQCRILTACYSRQGIFASGEGVVNTGALGNSRSGHRGTFFGDPIYVVSTPSCISAS